MREKGSEHGCPGLIPTSTGCCATGQVVHASRTGRDAGIHGWSRRVGDVTATSVVTVDRAAPYKEIARLLAGHRISGMPVLKTGREVAGVVTEADLLAAEDKTARRLRSTGRPRPWSRARPHPALTARELMTAPAVTTGPHVTVHAADRALSRPYPFDTPA